ncbi:hypothetical protein KKB43_03190 [Patescibacteria group bacterium]|nr:hypothetical protein [Patescibacteria group bacterium]MBU4579999.1 hypothetical protein [Patescibacteria group bacterium]
MDKKLIYALIFGILIISFSVFYYLVIFLPQKDKQIRQQEIQEKIEKCALQGNNFMKDFFKSKDSLIIEFQDSEFHYNQKLNVCLVSFVYSENSYRHWIYKNIYNVFSNQNLAESNIELIPNEEKHTNDRIVRSGLSEEEFDDKANLLMKE